LIVGADWGRVVTLAVLGVLATALAGWVVTRPLIKRARSPLSTNMGGRKPRSSPLSANLSGWRTLFRFIAASPRLALAGFSIKLLQILGKDVENLTLGRWPMVWSAAGLTLDLLFAVAWAAFALRIYLFALVPEVTQPQIRTRTRIAILYALAFWAVAEAVNIAGISLAAALHGADRGLIPKAIGYISFVLIVVSALTRPGIAAGLPRPLGESLRIIREQWGGALVTIALAGIPLGLVFFCVALVSDFVPLSVTVALALEVPIACLSALCYAAFESSVAILFRRVALHDPIAVKAAPGRRRLSK